MPNVVLVTGVSRYLGSRLAGRLAADPAIDRVIGVDTVAAVPGRPGPARPDRVRPGRHPQPADRQGDRAGPGRHRRARLGDRGPARRRRPGADEGTQRHRHHAAAGRLPEVRHGAPAGGQVHHRGLRRLPARPGDLHRGHAGPAVAAQRLRQGRGRGRGLRARLRPPPPGRRRQPCSGSPTSSARTSTPR